MTPGLTPLELVRKVQSEQMEHGVPYRPNGATCETTARACAACAAALQKFNRAKGRVAAYQRLAWAGSLSTRLGAQSAAFVLPSGAQQQGYLHETVVQHISALLSANLRVAAAVSIRASESQADFMWHRAQSLYVQPNLKDSIETQRSCSSTAGSGSRRREVDGQMSERGFRFMYGKRGSDTQGNRPQERTRGLDSCMDRRIDRGTDRGRDRDRGELRDMAGRKAGERVRSRPHR
jgi:hypothetical protein